MAIQGRPRRITKLHVDEISLVDKPANRTPFLLYKRDDSLDAAEVAKKADSGACECGVNCPEDCDCDDPNCPHAGRGDGAADERGEMPPGEGKMMGGKTEKCATPAFLASFVENRKSSEASARGLVKYDSASVSDTIGRVLALGKDSQAAINPDGPGGKPAGGETSKDVNGWLKDLGGKLTENPPDQDAGGDTSGASQKAIDPGKAEGFSGGMKAPEGPKPKDQSGGIATDPPNQDAGGSPKGASQAAI